MAQILLKRGKHKYQHHDLTAFGIHLKVIPFGAAIYLVNHSESLRVRRGRRSGAPDYLRRLKMRDAEADAAWAEFGLNEILGPRRD